MTGQAMTGRTSVRTPAGRGARMTGGRGGRTYPAYRHRSGPFLAAFAVLLTIAGLIGLTAGLAGWMP